MMFPAQGKWLLFVKGFFIGLGNTIPAISGATLALIFGVYEQILYSLFYLLKFPFVFFQNTESEKRKAKVVFPFLFFISSGVILGILLSANILSVVVEKFPLQMNAFFSGLAVSSLFFFSSALKGNVIKPKISFLLFLFGFSLAFLFQIRVFHEIQITFTSLLFVGFVAGSAMIIPGISGSLVLICLGFYPMFIKSIADFSHFSSESLPVLFPMGIGVIFGIFIFGFFIKKLLSSPWHFQVMLLLLGAILGSLTSFWFQFLKKHPLSSVPSSVLFLSSLFFLLGILLSLKLKKA